MTKVRFSGFPTGSTVTISALKGSVSRGPVTVSAWKQTTPPSGDASFDVFSYYGDDSAAAAAPWNIPRVTDGALIELPNHTGLNLVIDNFDGFAVTDPRKLFIETDFGERYDAQHLQHPYLRAGFTTLDPSGPRMGVYPGYVCGHAFRGTDMSGNQELSPDFAGDDGPIGTCDRTVTVTVTDGITTAQMSFTVRLVHPLRYYTDTGETPTTYALNDPGWRRGCIFVSRDSNDFTDAPSGPNIFHYTIPDGTLEARTFVQEFGDGPPLPKDIIDSETGLPVSDWSWRHNSGEARFAIFLREGQTFYPDRYQASPTNTIDWRLPQGNGDRILVSSWGPTGGKATISGERLQRWGTNGGDLFRDPNKKGFTGLKFHNVHWHLSDFDQTDPEWREWWNVIKYDTKVGHIQPTTSAAVYNGDILTNGSAYTQVITDDEAGTLICRQIVTGTDPANRAESGEPATFADGDTLEVVGRPGNSVRFIAAGSRQDRTRKTPPNGIGTSAGGGGDPAAGGYACVTLDNVTFQGARVSFVVGYWSTFSDILCTNATNYIVSGDSAYGHVYNGVVGAVPPSLTKTPRETGAGVHPLRNEFSIPYAVPGNALVLTGVTGEFATDDVVSDGTRYARVNEVNGEGGNRTLEIGGIVDNADLFNSSLTRTTFPDGATISNGSGASGTLDATASTQTETGVCPRAVENIIGHCVQRVPGTHALAFYKCGSNFWGGHGASHQPGYRMFTSAGEESNDYYVYIHGCFFCGGNRTLQFSNLDTRDVFPPKGIVVDMTNFRCDETNGVSAFVTAYTNVLVRRSTIGWPSDVDAIQGSNNNPIQFVGVSEAVGSDTDDTGALPVEFDDVTFLYQSPINQPEALSPWPVTMTTGNPPVDRGVPVTYTNCTLDVIGGNFPSPLPAFPT